MKKEKYIFYVLLFFLVMTGCAKKKESIEIVAEKETYVAEKVFSEDINYSSSAAGWVVGMDYYGIFDHVLFRCNPASRDMVQTPLDLGDLEPMEESRNYTDTNGVVHMLCKCLDQESGKYDAYICTFDSKGALLSKHLCTEIMKKAHYTAHAMVFLSSGELLIFYSLDDKQRQMLVSETGQIVYDVEEEDRVVDFKYKDDGESILYTEKGGLFTTSLKDGKWYQLDSEFVDGEFACFLEGLDEPNIFYYRTKKDIRQYNVKTKQIQIVSEFEDFLMDPLDVGWIIQSESGEFYILGVTGNTSFNFFKVRKANEGEAVPRKKELVLAFVGIEGIYDKEVYAFNKSQNEIRIRMKVYDDIDKMLAEITAGIIPDLIDLGDAVVYKALEDKDLLEDLHPFFAKDSSLSEEDFLEMSLEYYSENGKLYAIPYALGMCSMIGRSDFLGARDSWNLTEFVDFIDSFPRPDVVTGGITRNELFYYLCMQYFNHFVDTKNQKCFFQTEEFSQLLKCCNRFTPMDEDYFNGEELERKLVDGECILTISKIAGVNFDYAITRSLFQKEGKLIGFPSDGGNGCIVTAFPLGLAITKKEDREYAWEFVKFVMTQEHENLDYMDFVSYKPLNEKHINTLREEAESGKAIANLTVGNMTLDVAPATINEIEALCKMLQEGIVLKPNDYRILDIIDEEADSYFNGDKNEEQVAEIIQKRVSLFLSE